MGNGGFCKKWKIPKKTWVEPESAEEKKWQEYERRGWARPPKQPPPSRFRPLPPQPQPAPRRARPVAPPGFGPAATSPRRNLGTRGPRLPLRVEPETQDDPDDDEDTDLGLIDDDREDEDEVQVPPAGAEAVRSLNREDLRKEELAEGTPKTAPGQNLDQGPYWPPRGGTAPPLPPPSRGGSFARSYGTQGRSAAVSRTESQNEEFSWCPIS